MIYISKILDDYAKDNNLDKEDVEINIEISIYRDRNGEGVFISHDGSSGATYHVKNSEDVGNAISSYLDYYVI